MRKIFGLTFAFSAVLALIVGVAFAWTASTAATPSSATGGTLSVAPYGVTATGNQLYPTGNPITVLTGAIQNNTPNNPGVNVYIPTGTAGTVTGSTATYGACVSAGTVVGTNDAQVAPHGATGGAWEVDLTMPAGAPQACQGATFGFTYTINVVTP